MPKKKVVLSGVNMTEGGILTVFQELASEFSKNKNCEVICLVNSKGYFNGLDNVTFLEFPEVKTSWLKRLKFEYITSWFISKKIKPDVWFCLHDMTANTSNVNVKMVYCHNPSPFYKSNISEFKLDKKFYLFTKLYKYLYKINIKKNRAVIVQQQWIKENFSKWYGLNNVYVSKPVAGDSEVVGIAKEVNKGKVNLLYPAVPRVFKNFEVLLMALKKLKEDDIDTYNNLNLILTFNDGFNKVGDSVIEISKELGLNNVDFTGFLSKSDLKAKYSSDNTILVFPSKLETWGLPISEGKYFGLPMILADLPYAKETVGEYDSVNFFDPDSPEDFIKKLYSSLDNDFSGYNASVSDNTLNSWKDLVDFTLKGAQL